MCFHYKALEEPLEEPLKEPLEELLEEPLKKLPSSPKKCPKIVQYNSPRKLPSRISLRSTRS